MAPSDLNSSEESWHLMVGTGEQAFLGLVGIIMGIVGGMGNGVVVALVCCSPAMRSAINLLLATLALTDIILLFLIMPMDIVTLIGREWLLPISLCYAHEFLLTIVHLQGVVILTVICIDRYVIIVYRQDIMTPFMTSWVIAGSWIFSACMALPPLLGLGTYVAPPLPVALTHCMWRPASPSSVGELFYACSLFLLMYLLPVVTIATCFGIILERVHKNSAKVHTNSGDKPPNYNSVVVECSQDKGEEFKPSYSSRRPLVALDLCYKTRTFTTILMLFLVFLVCRTPLYLSQFAKTFTRNEGRYYEVYIWLLWWAYFQSAINPVIYTFRIKKFREELVEYFPCLLRVIPGPVSDGYRRSDLRAVYMIHEPRKQ